MESHHDPRYHAPARLSDLVGEERRRALIARDAARREAYLRAFRSSPETTRPPLISRLLSVVLGSRAGAVRTP